MVTAVEERKNKFIRYKNLRENATEVLEGRAKIVIPAEKVAEAYTAMDRVRDIADAGSFAELSCEFGETDPLEFNGYSEKKKALREET